MAPELLSGGLPLKIIDLLQNEAKVLWFKDMSVIVYIESEANKIKKASLEAVSYAKKISESLL